MKKLLFLLAVVAVVGTLAGCSMPSINDRGVQFEAAAPASRVEEFADLLAMEQSDRQEGDARLEGLIEDSSDALSQSLEQQRASLAGVDDALRADVNRVGAAVKENADSISSVAARVPALEAETRARIDAVAVAAGETKAELSSSEARQREEQAEAEAAMRALLTGFIGELRQSNKDDAEKRKEQEGRLIEAIGKMKIEGAQDNSLLVWILGALGLTTGAGVYANGRGNKKMTEAILRSATTPNPNA